MTFDRRYLVWALSYALAGMTLGIYMAVSGNHGQFVTHAHILLIGFLLSFCYGLIHRLWLVAPARAIARTQFVLHQFAALLVFAGLLLLYGGILPESVLAPILGAGSIGVLLGAALMLYMVVQPGAARAAPQHA
jgi:hypothetical protein